MKICLAMIVKNESKVIERCLESVKPFIDSYVISDTGSTDNTIELIKKSMKGIPGYVIKRKWIDYATNRNHVFDYIQKHKAKLGGDGIYALTVDADDVVIGIKPDTLADVGLVLQKSEGIEFNRRLLFNMKLPWKFIGKIHEVPTVGMELEKIITNENVENLIVDHQRDGISWQNQKEKYTEHVELAKTVEQKTPREVFYLAQSLRAAQRYQEAIEVYGQRIEMKEGYNQEAVYSQLQIARIYHTLGELDKATIEYLAAYELDSERIEALYELTCMARMGGKYNIGCMFGMTAINTPIPNNNDKLFLEIGSWGANLYLETGLCAYYKGNKKQAKLLWKKALRMKDVPKNIKEKLLENMKYVE